MLDAVLSELDHPDSAWNRAADAEAHVQADPLCCRSEWQLSYYETISSAEDPVVYATSDSVLVMALENDGFRDFALTPFDTSWCFGFPVLGPDGPALMREALADLDGIGSSLSVLLTAVIPGSPRMKAWMQMFEGWKILLREDGECCSARLDGGFDGFLSRRSGLMRRNLRKASGRAREAGIRFERCTPRSAEEAEAAWARIVAVEGRSWKGLAEKGVLEPAVHRFYALLIGRLAKAGLARVVFARHEDTDIGFLFGGLSAGVFRAQQCSFANEWRASSLGNLLQLETVRWITEGDAWLYHMGPTMEYKLHWAEVRCPMQSVLFVDR